MNTFVLSGVNAAAFLLCAAFCAYVTCIVVPLLRHRPTPAGDPDTFSWHFLVPCLNEERVIAATVADLLAKFPSAHIWCIDDASADATLKIISFLARRHRRVHVVARRPPEAQQGKGPALNAGWEAIVAHLPNTADWDRVMVGVVDADGSLDRRCLAVISGPAYFGDPAVSAVQVLVRVVNTDPEAATLTRVLTRLQDMEFSCTIAGMQMLRRHVGSSGMGGNGQFTRATALQKVADTYGAPWSTALVEDFELGLRILLTGGGTEYCHDTFVVQQGPPTFGRLIRQRCRWGQGVMQCFRYFMPVMRSRRISTAAAMEIAVFVLLPWFQLIGTVVYLVSVGVLADYAVTSTGGPVHWFGAGAWGLVPLFLVFGLAPLSFWGPVYHRTVGKDLNLAQSILLGMCNWPYSYMYHVTTWWAFSRMVRARTDWKKTDRVAPVALPARTRQPMRPAMTVGRPRGAPPAPVAAQTRPERSVPARPLLAPVVMLPAPAAELVPARGPAPQEAPAAELATIGAATFPGPSRPVILREATGSSLLVKGTIRSGRAGSPRIRAAVVSGRLRMAEPVLTGAADARVDLG